ncbi:MAG: ribose 5-phosphate isomerase B [Pirellulales bacterium]
MRITIGSDHRGHGIRSQIVESIGRLGYEIEDVGAQTNGPVDYPDIAALVAGKVSSGEADRGVLVGGTGLGMCIAANKFPGVRAAPCHDELTAEMSRRHNDLNVLCLSAELLSDSMVQRIVEVWLKTPFEGGRHARRVKKIAVLERDREPQLLREVLKSHERERTLLACELHDGLAQKLASVLMQLQAIEQGQDRPSGKAERAIHTAVQLLVDSIGEVRRLMSGLRPSMLEEAGLAVAIESVIRMAEKRDGPKIEFVHHVQIDQMAAPLEMAIFRIVQESVANACRYSKSEKVRVAVVGDEQTIHVEIQDWGIGFDPRQVGEHCFGLRGIRERAGLLGGQASIETAPGTGTRIAVKLPLVLRAICGPCPTG